MRPEGVFRFRKVPQDLDVATVTAAMQAHFSQILQQSPPALSEGVHRCDIIVTSLARSVYVLCGADQQTTHIHGLLCGLVTGGRESSL